MMDLSIVIPTYGRATVLPGLIQALRQQLAADFVSQTVEIIVVDDCSQDQTPEVLANLCQQWPDMHGLRLCENRGQQLATLAGLRHSQGQVVVTMDDDGKDRPKDIVRLVQGLANGFDIVFGVPSARTSDRSYRRMGTASKEALFWLICKKPRNLRLTGFRAMTRPTVDRLCSDWRQHVYLSATLLREPVRIGQIDVSSPPGLAVQSGYTWSKLMRLAVQMTIACCSAGQPAATQSQIDRQYQIEAFYGQNPTDRVGSAAIEP